MKLSNIAYLLFGHLIFSAYAENEKEFYGEIAPKNDTDRTYYIATDVIDVINEDGATNGFVNFNSMMDKKYNTLWTDMQCEWYNPCTTGNWTIFAFTDTAFAASDLNAIFTKYISSSQYNTHGEYLMQYHITEGILKASRLRPGRKIPTLYEGRNILTGRDINGTCTLTSPGSTANIVSPDFHARNGYVHGIDEILLPEFATRGFEEGLMKLGQFSEFLRALNETGVADTLTGTGPYTVFAPTNIAFNSAYYSKLSDEDKIKLVQYYILSNKATFASSFSDGTQYSLEGTGIEIEVSDRGDVRLDGKANIIEADIMVVNGLIHKIDGFLVPDLFRPDIARYIESKSSFSTLRNLLVRAGLLDTFYDSGDYTFFAPTNTAFEKSSLDWDTMDNSTVEDILKYHYISNNPYKLADMDGQYLAVSGGYFVVNGYVVNENSENPARVVDKDIVRSNGIIHVINRVLERFTILDVADSLGLDTLLETIELANLTSELDDPSPTNQMTLVAPTNQAFKYIGDISNVSSTVLADIVHNHLFTGVKTYSALTKASSIKSMAGNTLSVKSYAMVNSTGVSTNRIFLITSDVAARFKDTELDIYASNGIVHVINRVLVEDKALLGHANLFQPKPEH